MQPLYRAWAGNAMAKTSAMILTVAFALLHVGSLDAQSLNSCNGNVSSIGNGMCDDSNNNAQCGYDGGDCCLCTCVGAESACGMSSDFYCMDPSAGSAELDCLSSRPVVAPCSPGAQTNWVVEDNAGATALAKGMNCSGGTFVVEWRGNVNVSDTVYVADGTTLNVTGDAQSVADGGGTSRLFAVMDASLHVSNLNMRNGFALVGGTIYATNSNVTMDSMVFDFNHAKHGGAIFASGSSVSWSGYTVFRGNSATNSGGALFARDSSTISWSGKTLFAENTATGGGGAIYGRGKSNVSWTGEAVFTSNSAGVDGGAVYLKQESSVSWSETSEFVNNSAAHNGGVFYVQHKSSVSWGGGGAFAGNSAGFDGGVIYLYNASTVSWMSNTEFANNTAGVQGGALALYLDDVSQQISGNGTANFSRNRCGEDGGAIFLSGNGVFPTRLVGNIVFHANYAGVAGGAVAVSSASVGPQFVGASFFGNSALVGGAVYLLASGTEAKGYAKHPTSFIGCTFDGNTAGAGGGAIKSSSGVDRFFNTSFVGNKAREGGALRLAGRADMENCSFQDNVSNEGGGPAVLNIGVIEPMKNCRFTDNGYSCPPNTFLDASEGNRYQAECAGCAECHGCSVKNNGSVAACEPQFEHSNSTGGYTTLQTLRLDAGYWRTSDTSREILACYNPAACLGGVSSHEYCNQGYTGPYCSVCTEGYMATLAHVCTKCSSAGVGVVVTVVFAAVSLVVLSAFVAYMVSRNVEDSRRTEVAQIGPRIPRQSLKIVVVAWQIVTKFSSVANVRYPDLYQRFLDSINVINFNLEWVFAATCVVEVDFHNCLLLSTLGPMSCACLLGLTYRVAVQRNKGSFEALEKVHRKHVSAVTLLTFLVYSSVSATVFQMFACDTLDDGRVYLRADYRIECDSEKHQWLQIYAAFMILVYPVGIPLSYIVLLFRFREVLKDGDKRMHDSRVQPISDLWKNYRPNRFYYEILECGRRIMLTGVVVFIFPDTAAQIAVTILFGVGFIFLSEGLAPFESKWDVWISRTGHAIVFLSMYVALLLKVDVSDERQESQKVFAGILVATHSLWC